MTTVQPQDLVSNLPSINRSNLPRGVISRGATTIKRNDIKSRGKSVSSSRTAQLKALGTH